MSLSQFVAIFLSEDIALLQSCNGAGVPDLTNHDYILGTITDHGCSFMA